MSGVSLWDELESAAQEYAESLHDRLEDEEIEY